MDRPKNAELKALGEKLKFYKGLPEMFEEFAHGLLTEEHVAHGITVEHYIISSGIKVLIEGSQPRAVRARDFRLRICRG